MEKSSLNLDHLPSGKDVSCYALFYVDKEGSIMFDMSWGHEKDDILNLIQLLFSIKRTKIIDNGLNSSMENSEDSEDVYATYAIIEGLKKMERVLDDDLKENTKPRPVVRPIENK